MQIGAPDVAFPRLNGIAYWLYLFGGLIVLGSFATPEDAADWAMLITAQVLTCSPLAVRRS
ncbi:hypothetical protein Q2K19_29320 [Micromonospora soli]|uniref:hypothetical protein n=1 Tax=Micromonospora sp. NBRC 110009 TaxID=3061627 RepID=UPI002672FAF5|nr:hypothetical protein [Micromonospora sp. NBRC 110009]WKT98215.1 hypothetical protein Q2K19_29320 [Micromonospora sp. NBRC 110009]